LQHHHTIKAWPPTTARPTGDWTRAILWLQGAQASRSIARALAAAAASSACAGAGADGLLMASSLTLKTAGFDPNAVTVLVSGLPS